MSSANQVLIRESPVDPVELSPAGFERFARFITSELGIKMPESKLTMVQSRLLRRVRDLRLESVDRYCDYFFASSSAEERQHFINAITTNKTDFYREPEHFAFLSEKVLPAASRARDRAGTRFKAWSAGCSSGGALHPGDGSGGVCRTSGGLRFRDSGDRHFDQSAGQRPTRDLPRIAGSSHPSGSAEEIPAPQPKHARPGARGPPVAEESQLSSVELHGQGLWHPGTPSTSSFSATS